jgi:hypothetical protein
MKARNICLFLPSRNSSDVSKLIVGISMSCFHFPVKVGHKVLHLRVASSDRENVLTIITEKFTASFSTLDI